MGKRVTNLIKISAQDATLVLAPEQGGAIARLDVAGKQVLRPWSGQLHDGPFALASNILVPFSNRISNNGFTFEGKFYHLPTTLKSEKMPIHGDGFVKPWQVVSQDHSSAVLALTNGAIGPFLYAATQVFTLTPTALEISLTIKNTGKMSLPFGGGFHPWFPCDEKTSLQFSAKSVWLVDQNRLPVQQKLLSNTPEWNYATAKKMHKKMLDNCWTGWSGTAIISQGERYVSTKITASETLDYALVHCKPDAGFLCFEPVSHPVDSINMAGRPGLYRLEPLAELHFSTKFEFLR